MSQGQLPDAVSRIISTGRVTAEDVLRLRRLIYGGPIITQDQIESLFAIDHACAERSPEWLDLFSEALVDYLVRQQEPRGYVDEANARWLIDQISSDGRIETETELEALIAVLEQAQRSPERLVRFALDAVKATVLEGAGPARRGGHYKPGVVTEADVSLLRRILYAYGGDQHIAVSRTEAEILFDINDRTTEAENDPSWSDLFMKAIANSVLFFSGYTVPTRQEALRREAWLDEPASMGSFFSRMAQGLGSVFSGYARPGSTGAAQRSGSVEDQVKASWRVTEDEAQWLAGRIGGDHKVHENEQALLAFLRDNATSIHPCLKPLLQIPA